MCLPLSKEWSHEPNGVRVRKRETDEGFMLLAVRVFVYLETIDRSVSMAYMLGAKEIMPAIVASFVGCA